MAKSSNGPRKTEKEEMKPENKQNLASRDSKEASPKKPSLVITPKDLHESIVQNKPVVLNQKRLENMKNPMMNEGQSSQNSKKATAEERGTRKPEGMTKGTMDPQSMKGYASNASSSSYRSSRIFEPIQKKTEKKPSMSPLRPEKLKPVTKKLSPKPSKKKSRSPSPISKGAHSPISRQVPQGDNIPFKNSKASAKKDSKNVEKEKSEKKEKNDRIQQLIAREISNSSRRDSSVEPQTKPRIVQRLSFESPSFDTQAVTSTLGIPKETPNQSHQKQAKEKDEEKENNPKDFNQNSTSALFQKYGIDKASLSSSNDQEAEERRRKLRENLSMRRQSRNSQQIGSECGSGSQGSFENERKEEKMDSLVSVKELISKYNIPSDIGGGLSQFSQRNSLDIMNNSGSSSGSSKMNNYVYENSN